MIPYKLRLSNFTSYTTDTPELDFSAFHLAAISGLNGSGKSSLVDSITWALWGESRSGSNADKLVRSGETLMSVEFEFELDDIIYKVVRKRSLKNNGLTSLEFFCGERNLTEGTIKTTQQKINSTLHLDYEVFTNSSYLRQGRADEFTLKPPTERKEILSNILGLDSFDIYEERAKERVKICQTTIQSLDYQILELENELSFKEEREKNLSLIEQEANSAQKEVNQKDQLLKHLQEEENKLNLELASLKEKDVLSKALKKELSDISLQIELKEKAKKEFEDILLTEEEINNGFKTLQNLQQQKKVLEVKRSELIKTKDELSGLQKILMAREEKRSSELTKIKIQIQDLETKNHSIKTQNTHLEEHKDNCPTCGQNIGEAKNKEIITKNKLEIESNNQSISTLQAKYKQYESYVIPELAESTKKEEEIKHIEEQTSHYGETDTKLSTFEKYADLYLKLQEAKVGSKVQDETVQDLKKTLESKNLHIKTLESELEGLEAKEKSLIEMHNTKLIEERIKQELSSKLLALKGRAGEARSLVSRSQQVEENLKQKTTQKSTLSEQRNAFEELAAAFGKKGIQAMLIETVIPEIEEESNLLLERLTDGRMRVGLSTQRESKTGATIETLDIIISDENGPRSYETYSGGEAFRVNIAIRLALSKLLTRRAGARLQFLVIDEGFGTQDSQGRDKVVEAINLIQDSFAKILVITHIEELKDAFPAKIEVSKSDQGSTFVVKNN